MLRLEERGVEGSVCACVGGMRWLFVICFIVAAEPKREIH